MTDIVERLRDPRRLLVTRERIEAADTIESLREALRLYVSACGNTAAVVDRELVQEAYRRARAALSKVSEPRP